MHQTVATPTSNGNLVPLRAGGNSPKLCNQFSFMRYNLIAQRFKILVFVVSVSTSLLFPIQREYPIYPSAWLSVSGLPSVLMTVVTLRRWPGKDELKRKVTGQKTLYCSTWVIASCKFLSSSLLSLLRLLDYCGAIFISLFLEASTAFTWRKNFIWVVILCCLFVIHFLGLMLGVITFLEVFRFSHCIYMAITLSV